MKTFYTLTALCSGILYGGVCHIVDGDRITGRDLVKAVPDLVGLDPQADIARSPLPGVQRIFHSEEVLRVAREHSLKAPERPGETCFELRTQPLTPEILAPALDQALADSKAQIEILDFSRYPVPQGTLEFPRGALVATGVWRGRLVYGEGRSAPVWVRVHVTNRETGADISLAPTAGVRDVNRGDPVHVEVRSGRAVIAFDSKAESSGRIGEMVLVQNPDNTRKVLAKIEDKGKVVIQK